MGRSAHIRHRRHRRNLRRWRSLCFVAKALEGPSAKELLEAHMRQAYNDILQSEGIPSRTAPPHLYTAWADGLTSSASSWYSPNKEPNKP